MSKKERERGIIGKEGKGEERKVARGRTQYHKRKKEDAKKRDDRGKNGEKTKREREERRGVNCMGRIIE